MSIAHTLPASSVPADGQKKNTFANSLDGKNCRVTTNVTQSIKTPIKHVRQEHSSGCFIACVAMLLGLTYEESFRLIHPDKNPLDIDRWGFPELHNPYAAFTIDQALSKLPDLGIQTKLAKSIHLDKLVKSDKTALIVIRWEDAIHAAHGLVYDGSQKRILDPSHYQDFNIASSPHLLKSYGRQVEKILYVR